MWVLTRVDSHNVGFWTLVWRLCSLIWMPGQLRSFVVSGRGSPSFLVNERREKIVTLEVRRIHSTSDARPWLLTCEWGVWRDSMAERFGQFSAAGGDSMEAGGAEPSNGKALRFRTRKNGITSTSDDRKWMREQRTTRGSSSTSND